MQVFIGYILCGHLVTRFVHSSSDFYFLGEGFIGFTPYDDCGLIYRKFPFSGWGQGIGIGFGIASYAIDPGGTNRL